MAENLSPAASERVAQYQSFTNDIGRLNHLVEQFAISKSGHEAQRSAIKRLASQLKLKFLTLGFAQLAQIAGNMVFTAGRSGTPAVTSREFREQIGALKFQIEMETRAVANEDREAQAAKRKHSEEVKSAAAELAESGPKGE